MTGSVACAVCGTRFTPAKPWAKFCSDACRIRAHRAKTRTVAVAGLDEAESALVAALTAVRAGDAPEARMATRIALRALEAGAPDPLLAEFERAVRAGWSVANIARGAGLANGSPLSRWRGGGRIAPATRAKLAKWLGANGYGAGD